jgi:phage terminase small subunit
MGNEAPHKYKRIDNLKKTKAPEKAALAPRELTLKQALFCQEYVANDGNGSEAAKKAGYSEASAHDMSVENLQKPAIQARIASIQKNRAARLEADADWVVKELKLTLKSARKAKDHAGCNRALELIGKAGGMFTDAGAQRVETAVTVNLKFPAKVAVDAAALIEIDPEEQE